MVKIKLLLIPLFLIAITWSQESTNITCLHENGTCNFDSEIIEKSDTVVILKDEDGDFEDSEIVKVVFKNCKIFTIPKELFTKFQNLEEVEMNKQEIQEISWENFIDAKNLKNC